MSRVFPSLLLAAGLLLTGATRALAAESDVVIAPGNPPLTRAAADASAEVTVFMLQVVATGEAEALDLDASLLDEWADALASEYSAFSSDEQAQFATLPILRDALYLAWPAASDSDRNEIRNAFRPMADGMLSGMSCDGFVSLADSGLVEPTSGNIARYRRYSAGDVVQAAPTPAPAPAAAPAQATTAATTESPTAAYQRASAGLAASHNMYVNMSNVLLQNHVGNMNAILNMGNSNYRYEYVSRP